MKLPKFKNEPHTDWSKAGNRTKRKSQHHKAAIGMKPFEGYNDIAREERKMLQRMTPREARKQTEILLRAAAWMK